MARHRYTPDQIVHKLREGDKLLSEGRSLAEVYKHLEISEQSWASLAEPIGRHESRRGQAHEFPDGQLAVSSVLDIRTLSFDCSTSSPQAAVYINNEAVRIHDGMAGVRSSRSSWSGLMKFETKESLHRIIDQVSTGAPILVTTRL